MQGIDKPLALVCAFCLPLFCGSPPANSSAEDTAVDAAVRLADYKKYSVFPDSSRPARPDSPELDQMRPSKNTASGAEVRAWGKPAESRGSLVIPFQITVREPGRYAFSTLVKKPDGTKFAVLTRDGELDAGEKTISFELLGKIMRDASYASPFLLEGIAGERIATEQDVNRALASGKEPPSGRLGLFRKEIRIEGHRPEEFSAAEWSSPEKLRKIAELEAEVRQGRK